MTTATRPLFQTGQLVSTPAALDALGKAGQEPMSFIDRHRHGDWGVVDDEDKQTNDWAVEQGDRVLSAYLLSDETKIWVLTESNRAVTTVLLPSDY